MVLAVSITNQDIQFGCYRDGSCVAQFSLAAESVRTADEYAVLLAGGMSLKGMDAKAVTGAIVSSVFPPLTKTVKQAISIVSGVVPSEVGPGLKTGLNIKIENPAQLGSDLVAMTVGALTRYSAPLLLVNFEVATTISIVDDSRAFCGAILAPGIAASISSLSKNAANLPEISLEAPRDIVGKNTVEAMRSGAVYGGAAMLDGFISRLSERFSMKPTVVAAGKHCSLILQHCESTVQEDQMLVLDGLYAIYQKNQ